MSEQAKKPSKTDVVFWTVVGVLISVLVLAIAVPNFIKARSTSAGNACLNNLRQIDAAANQYALEKDLKTGDKINFPNDLTPYIKLNSAGSIPSCPNGGIYYLERVGETPTCSLATNGFPWHKLQ